MRNDGFKALCTPMSVGDTATRYLGKTIDEHLAKPLSWAAMALAQQSFGTAVQLLISPLSTFAYLTPCRQFDNAGASKTAQ